MKIKGQEQIADVLGVAPKTIVEWQEQGFPVAKRGKRGVPSEYDTDVCIAWFVKRELDKLGTEVVRDRLTRLQADEVEMRILERRGQLIPVEQIEPAWIAMVTAARSYLRQEPDRLAHLLDAIEGIDAKRDLIAETFDDFLRKLSTFDPEDAGASDGPAASPASRVQAVGSAAEDVGSGMG